MSNKEKKPRKMFRIVWPSDKVELVFADELHVAEGTAYFWRDGVPCHAVNLSYSKEVREMTEPLTCSVQLVIDGRELRWFENIPVIIK